MAFGHESSSSSKLKPLQLEKLFNTDNLQIVKIEEMIFENMTPSKMDRLTDLVEVSCKNYYTTVSEITTEFGKRRGCKTTQDYCNYVEFTEKYLLELKDQKEVEFQADLEDRNSENLETISRGQYVELQKNSQTILEKVFDDFHTSRREEFQCS